MGMKGVLVVVVPNFVALDVVAGNDMDFFYYRKI
jgi:hypothetical protein